MRTIQSEFARAEAILSFPREEGVAGAGVLDELLRDWRESDAARAGAEADEAAGDEASEEAEAVADDSAEQILNLDEVELS